MVFPDDPRDSQGSPSAYPSYLSRKHDRKRLNIRLSDSTAGNRVFCRSHVAFCRAYKSLHPFVILLVHPIRSQLRMFEKQICSRTLGIMPYFLFGNSCFEIEHWDFVSDVFIDQREFTRSKRNLLWWKCCVIYPISMLFHWL